MYSGTVVPARWSLNLVSAWALISIHIPPPPSLSPVISQLDSSSFIAISIRTCALFSFIISSLLPTFLIFHYLESRHCEYRTPTSHILTPLNTFTNSSSKQP
ncbi:hypothetical protein QR685DRAFT_342474 [Neurospora intermedia]|uniref:Uncharacterized protein n=1 Tax=Neurospora intermedia TaxID=5142 RepID=A0ABR3D722_NEUIN